MLEKFFRRLCFSCNISAPGAYTGKICKKEVHLMEIKETIFPHGDVDDLIYQEEWTASER